MSTYKQDEEPNPFDESFSSVSSPIKFDNAYRQPGPGVLNWVSDISSYTYDSNSVNDSYSSVSTDHQATIRSSSEDSSSNHSEDAYHNDIGPKCQTSPGHQEDVNSPPQLEQQQQKQEHEQQVHFINNNSIMKKQHNKTSKKRNRKTKIPEDEEKRKNFLERNRIAALKCRQRKKQWLSNMQTRVEYLTNDNEHLSMEADALRNEILNLKTLLTAHKDCPQYKDSIAQHDRMFGEYTNSTNH